MIHPARQAVADLLATIERNGGCDGLVERIERVARRHREVTGCGYEEAATVALELIKAET